ncbi:UvrD-helicase domain-containing protein [Hyphobacterium sp.]|uniref:UvrD-helicase domain-containing protein n=1 Tax=Hyphobacterium sp. TaxID=2004662 RepID=UPI003BA85A12
MSAIIDQASAQQGLAARPDHHIHVEANAGSGKTRVLVNRVARLLLSGSAPDKILCLTYTKAAAGEMKSRLFATLGSWSIADDDDLTTRLNELYNQESGAFSADELAQARKLFARALETPGGLAVQTIHAFCQSLLQRFPLEAGLPPGFEVADDADQREISSDARRGLLLAAQEDAKLNTALRLLAARSVDALDLILRMAAVKRLEFSEMLDRQDAGELDRGLRETLGLSADATLESVVQAGWTGTPIEALKSAAETMQTGSVTDQKNAGFLLEALESADRQAAFELMGQAYFTQKGKIRSSLVTKAIRDAFPAIPDLLASEAERVLALRETLACVDLVEASHAATLISAEYLRRYEAGLRSRHRLDYADLIARAVQLLRDSGARDWVRYKLDAGIDHVLVDEAQDNAPEQWQVIGALVEEYFAGSGIERERTRTVFTVGDEKQSIYSFQGAEPKQFLAWGEQVAADSAASGQLFEQPALSVSFRSSPVILEAVDAAFEPERQLGEIKSLAQAPEVKFLPEEAETGVFAPAPEAFERYQTHHAAWTGRPGLVELWPSLPRIPDKTDPDPTAPVDRESAASAPHRLAGLVADEIRRILDDGDGVHDEETGGRRPARPKDILVLVARRSGFFRELIRQLKLRAVPVAGADRMVLMDELAVQDLINLAEVALNPLDDLKLAELLKTPFFDPVDGPRPIDEDELFTLAYNRGERKQRIPLWSRLQDSQREALQEAKTAIERARNRIETAGVFGFFADFLNERSATGETRQKRLFARLGEEARDPVEEFLARAIVFEQQNHASLHGFVAAMKAGSGEIKREMDEGRGEVRVMTVHGSKGLKRRLLSCLIPPMRRWCAVTGGFISPRSTALSGPRVAR